MRPYDLLWEHACDGSVISVASTGNCSAICAATIAKSVYFLDGEGEPLWDEPYRVDHEAWSVAISDDSRYIAIGTASKSPAHGTLYVLTRDRRLFWSVRIRAPIWSVSLSADGRILAASTWGENKLYLFERTGSRFVEVSCVRVPGSSGLYGARLTRDGQSCVVASYESGLYTIETGGGIGAHAPLSSGLYNLALAPGRNAAYVGTRDGTFATAALDGQMTSWSSPAIAERPICGISVSENGLLVACGSFDGRIIVANDRGGALWDYQTKGEVWTTAISTNGALVCAGCGDHKVRMFRNHCDTAAYHEIRSLEDALARSQGDSSSILTPLIDLYIRHGLTTYGYSCLTRLLNTNADAHIFKDELRKFLEGATHQDPEARSSLDLAGLLADEKRYLEAIRHLHTSARDPVHRSSAQRRAAECFAELGLQTAATSAWRQSREQHLDDNARHILFMLARSYEDYGDWHLAGQIYEMIVSWDADYRDSWAKLGIARNFRHAVASVAAPSPTPHAGVATSLLGPDAPRDIDVSLADIMKARRREVVIGPGDREMVRTTVLDLLADEAFSRGIRRDSSHLSYDLQLFLKYDFGLPEDEMKKFLETVNAQPHFRRVSEAVAAPASLDIGSATGRYPMLLTRLGFQAHGIDIAENAVEYSIKKVNGAEWPKFVLGNACELDRHFEAGQTFDLITCMMGTFNHIPRDLQPLLISKIQSRLNPGGAAIISVWDVECPHLAYLSIYDEVQKEKIRQNSKLREDMRGLLKDAGFSEVIITPFCLLPQTAIYDLGIEGMGATDIEIAAQADLAARALFTNRHGEMFLAIGYR